MEVSVLCIMRPLLRGINHCRNMHLLNDINVNEY